VGFEIQPSVDGLWMVCGGHGMAVSGPTWRWRQYIPQKHCNKQSETLQVIKQNSK